MRQSLKSGVPEAAGGRLQDGLSGVSIFGLDSETVLRPNPGQPYLSLQMMAGKSAWRVAGYASKGIADIEANTQHSYGCVRRQWLWRSFTCTSISYRSAASSEAIRIKTAAWLDGQPV